MQRLRTRGRHLIDAEGRRVILRGANVSGRHKQPPFTFAHGPSDLAPLVDLGFDALRLVLVWEAVEPEPGVYDEGYLERVRQTVRWAEELGLWVVWDMHQDIYARAFGGSGAPAWTIPEGLRPSEPPAPNRDWFLEYARSGPVRECLARFFTNADGVQDRFVAALSKVAQALADAGNVIGFEPYNEPFGGDLDLARFEVDHLTPFYRRCLEAGRAAQPEWLFFFEGALFTSEQGTLVDLSGYDGLVYMPHFYVKLAHAALRYDGDAQEMEAAFATFDADAARMDVPWMLGEYGYPYDAVGGLAYQRDHEQALERYRAGGFVWQHNPTRADWNDERMALVRPDGAPTDGLAPIARPYPQAVAGADARWGYDDEARRFSLSYRPEPLSAPTVVRLPEPEDPLPPAVEAVGAEWRQAGSRLELTAEPGAEEVRLTVTWPRR